MNYENTKILIVTCYLLPMGHVCRSAFVLPSLCLRYTFASGSLPSMEYQRTYNGLITEVHRNYIEGSWKFLHNLIESPYQLERWFGNSVFHSFLCGVNEFSMMSTKSGLCKPFQENDNLSSMMSTNAV